ncbi:MAG TPA: helix-turn-helix transcriptional regulator [Spirochaetia bacterium]|nr:helix-turn-helix transcriptional regulator [Spirochaetia bacterium]
MLHVFLAVQLFSFSVGLVIITLSLLAQSRSGQAEFRHVALLFTSVLLLLLAGALKTYEDATVERVFGNILPTMSLVLGVPGNGLLASMICTLSSEVVSFPVSPPRRDLHIILTVGAVAAAVVKEMFPQRLSQLLNDAVLTGILIYGVLVIVRHMGNVKDVRLRTLLRGVSFVAAVMVTALAIQIICQAALPLPVPFDRFPFVQTLFYLSVVGLLLQHAARYLFQPEIAPAFQLPSEIVKQYGISPREREIITMIVQGYTNRVIGEKLFISSTTVKNHIYHIYQKTGVTNKIQLINLLNSPK